MFCYFSIRKLLSKKPFFLLLLVALSSCYFDNKNTTETDTNENSKRSNFQPSDNALYQFIKNTIEHSDDSMIYVCGLPMLTSETVKSFYRKNKYQSVWVNEKGLKPSAEQLLIGLSRSHENGLRPEDYHLIKLNRIEQSFSRFKLKKTFPELEDLLLAEMLMTDAYLLYSAHLYYGKTDPETTDPMWHAERNDCSIALDEHLIYALKKNEIAGSFQVLEPPFEEYGIMKRNLIELKHAFKRGELEQIDFGNVRKLEPGDSNDVIKAIKIRMKKMGEYESDVDFFESVYDSVLYTSIKLFQERNGLDADGIIGKGTMEALNITMNQRIQQLIINMERLRWLPKNENARYVMVNIADFSMKVVDNGKTIIRSKAIVGRAYRMTPVFSARMTYMVLNPYWTVPRTILREDVLPELKKDIAYLKKKNMQILDFKGNIVDPSSIDWKKISPDKFPYMIRQEPGKSNSLGIVKFMFPNKYHVYMHDTPDKKLFDKSERAYSSGCIRIQEYLKLAVYLLRKKEIDEVAFQKMLDSGKQQQINLPEPIMVHIVYFTVGISEKNEVVFRKDIYDRDIVVFKALAKVYD